MPRAASDFRKRNAQRLFYFLRVHALPIQYDNLSSEVRNFFPLRLEAFGRILNPKAEFALLLQGLELWRHAAVLN